MKKNKLSVLLLMLVMSLGLATAVNAVQPFEFLQPGIQFEMVGPSGEVTTLELQYDHLGAPVLNVQTDYVCISPFQIACCDVNRPMQYPVRIYRYGQHVGYGWIQICAGCRRSWPL